MAVTIFISAMQNTLSLFLSYPFTFIVMHCFAILFHSYSSYPHCIGYWGNAQNHISETFSFFSTQLDFCEAFHIIFRLSCEISFMFSVNVAIGTGNNKFLCMMKKAGKIVAFINRVHHIIVTAWHTNKMRERKNSTASIMVGEAIP